MDDLQPKTGYSDLAALVASRLCHDLINPLGAIGNGVELLAMTAATSGPEVALIDEAVRDAQSRIRFFRIAFGHAGGEARISRREISETLSGMFGQGGRLTVDFAPAADLPRSDAKLAFLMISCAEHALPLGGHIAVTQAGGMLRLEAEGRRINAVPELWNLVRGGAIERGMLPAEVQFQLFAQEALRQDRIVTFDVGEAALILTA